MTHARPRPGILAAAGATALLWMATLAAAGAAPVPSGDDTASVEETPDRPPRRTVAPDVRVLFAAGGGDHRWFLGGRDRGAGGYGLAHQPPVMASDAFRIVGGIARAPQAFVAWGPRAWLISEPPVAGAPAPVFTVRVAWNPVLDGWQMQGRMPLRPVPRLPAGVVIDLATAAPDGPVVLARPRAATDGASAPRSVWRLGVEQWLEVPLQDPAGATADGLAEERPAALGVVRVPDDTRPVDEDTGDASGEASGGASDADAPASGVPSSDDPASGQPGTTAGDTDGGVRGTPVTTALLLASWSGDRLVVDSIARDGRRTRLWRSEPIDAGADGERPAVHLVDVGGRPWIARLDGAVLHAEPVPLPRASGEASLPEGEPLVVRADRDGRAARVVGGDSLLLLEGSALEDAEDPPSARGWTPGGLPEALSGGFAVGGPDPSTFLRGPIVLGTGVFFATIAGVLMSRPGPRPPAIEGRQASAGVRLLAGAIDGLAPAVAGILIVAPPAELLQSLLLLHVHGLVPWVQFVILWACAIVVGELAFTGRTPGRLLLGLEVVDDAGRRPGAGRLLLRFLGRVAAVAFPPLILFWLAHARNRALHDLLVGTWIVHVDPASPDRSSTSPPQDSH